MKCPKCGYLGFETTDRCRNCGYDFSLASPAPTAELALHEAADDRTSAIWRFTTKTTSTSRCTNAKPPVSAGPSRDARHRCRHHASVGPGPARPGHRRRPATTAARICRCSRLVRLARRCRFVVPPTRFRSRAATRLARCARRPPPCRSWPRPRAPKPSGRTRLVCERPICRHGRPSGGGGHRSGAVARH